ncbi:MAG TPA: hypothetical protein V6C64_02490 [Microcoleaceae cyanobacterium]|jgi:hypothetical protein
MRAFLLVIGALLALGISGFVGFLVGATGGSLAGTWGGANLGICEVMRTARQRQYMSETEAKKLVEAMLENSKIYPNSITKKSAREALSECLNQKVKSHSPEANEAQPEQSTITEPGHESETESRNAHDRNEPKGELSLPERSDSEEKSP